MDRLLSTVAAIVILVGALVAVAADASAKDRIAFASDRGGSNEIFVMDADGSHLVRLTSGPGSPNGEPDWSPDGTKFVFHSTRTGNFDVFVMHADGTNQVNLTNNAGIDMQPHWSPDGTKIAFASNRTGNVEVFVMNADGSNPVNLTNHPATEGHPVWSPDGSKIAFESNRNGNDEIYVMNSNGSNPLNLTNSPAVDQEPIWSPDGTHIAFAANRNGNFEIYVMGADGSLQMRITNNSASDTSPEWSPDGTKIAFQSLRGGNNDVFVMNADGTNQTNLTMNPASDAHATWAVIQDDAPTPDAGDDVAARVGDTVSLDGGRSFDDNTETENLKFDWTIAGAPDGSTATLVNPKTRTPNIVIDAIGTYEIHLVVTDEKGLSSLPDSVLISSDNLAPTACAGSDLLRRVGTVVNLHGSGSDPEDDPLTFSWSFVSRPPGSVAPLSNPTLPNASLIPDVAGDYVIRLQVSDLIGPSLPDTVTVTATSAADYAVVQILAASTILEELSSGSVTNSGNQNAFTNLLRQSVVLIREGRFADARDKLEQALARTDGCVLNEPPGPDGNGEGRDWITDCVAQHQVYSLLADALSAIEP
jgi:Tol biopolymer transport system component